MRAVWRSHPEDLTDAFNIRAVVFVGEQGFLTEFDARDRTSHHLVLYDDEQPLACARIYQEDGVYHAGRIAVLNQYRGKNLGAVLMAEIDKKIKSLGGGKIVLSAQCQARGFYEKQGFCCVSAEPYLDEHCPHVEMEKIVTI